MKWGITLLSIIVIAALAVPLISPYDYYTPAWTQMNLGPTFTGGHWLGTDDLGRDLLVRLMWGCRISIAVGLAASIVSLVIGVAWGVTAGYAGGWADSLMMRIVDVLYSVPLIPFIIVLTVLFGRDLVLLFVAIGAVSWLDIARIVRGQALALREREYVAAARVAGASGAAIVWRHLVPNLAGIVLAYLTLTIPTVILFEAFLSFLGLGAQAPLTSLGVLIADGAARMQDYPLLLIAPVALLALLVFALNILGEALRERFDPLRRRA